MSRIAPSDVSNGCDAPPADARCDDVAGPPPAAEEAPVVEASFCFALSLNADAVFIVIVLLYVARYNCYC